MIYGLSNDGLALVGIIAAVGLAIFLQIRSELKHQTTALRSQTNNFVQTEEEMEKMNRFLAESTEGAVDEKIAVLYKHTNDVKNLQNIDINYLTERIVSDLTSMTRVNSRILKDQRIRLNEAISRLTTIMHDKKYDTVKIESVAKLLASG
jgi:hypothetical protein